MIYFNDYFIRNGKSGKSGKFEKKLRSVEKRISRAFARTRAKKSDFFFTKRNDFESKILTLFDSATLCLFKTYNMFL